MKLRFSILDQQLSVCQIHPGEEIPSWVFQSEFYSVTKTEDEISIITDESNVPRGIKRERGWVALKLEGPFAFTLTGVLASVASPLAEHGISLFAMSTYNTDYILVKAEMMDQAIGVLKNEGHQFINKE